MSAWSGTRASTSHPRSSQETRPPSLDCGRERQMTKRVTSAGRITKALRATAYHEAGHALAAWKERLPISTISIIPDEDGTLGRVTHQAPPASFQPDIDAGLRVRDRIEKHAIVAFAGVEAERLVAARVSSESGARDRAGAAQLVAYLGGSVEEQRAYLQLLSVRARQLVRVPHLRVPLDALATALLDRRHISGPAARKILKESLRKHVTGARQ